MNPIFLSDPMRSAIMRGPLDGELMGGTLVFVDRSSLDENTERNFSLSHFLCDIPLFGGVDIAKGSVIDGTRKQVNNCLYNYEFAGSAKVARFVLRIFYAHIFNSNLSED